MASEGFPIIEQLNTARHSCFSASHSDHNSALQQAGYWMAHKGLTVVTVPTNIAGICAGSIGAMAGALVLGSAKILTFALTCGFVKPTFPTGFLFFGERAQHSFENLVFNTGELLVDGVYLVIDAIKTCHKIAEKLHCADAIRAAFHALGRGLSTVCRYAFQGIFNVCKGIGKAAHEEPDFDGKTCFIIKPVDDVAANNRIDLNNDERSFGTIAKHAIASIINIPANGVVAMCSGAALMVLSPFFFTKAALYTVLDVSVPVPTYAGKAAEKMLVSGNNVLTDVATDVADVFVVTYKISDAIGLNKLATTALRVICYIPEAVFS